MPANIDIFFSAMDQRPERASCIRMRGSIPQELDFWRFGALGSGRSFGVIRGGVATDPGYYEYEAALVAADGLCRVSTRLGKHYGQHLPEVMVDLPGEGRLIWLLEGSLYCWEGLEGLPAIRVNDRLLAETAVEDAVLRESGILELFCAGGQRFGYVYDADALLDPFGEGWLAHAGEDCCNGWNTALQDCMAEEALPWGLAIDEGVPAVEWLCFSECGLRELHLPESLERIGPEAFSENPALERVTIPKGVRMVEENAFRGCTGLREVQIEGDLDRLRLWDETAFAGCPCAATIQKWRERGMANS